MSEHTFEEKQKQLEEIVTKLESGNAPLEEMIRMFEQGEALYKECADMLDVYEKRLNAIDKENA